MKLLIVTQKVNQDDPILGFFHRWIIEFAKNFYQVTVLALEVGAKSLPQNVRVISLGKNEGLRGLALTKRFLGLILVERKNYDVVFVHMNPIYAAIGGLVWKLLGKKIFLWYTHKNIDTKLKMAHRYVSRVFTASKEGFRIGGPKMLTVGHGIDVGSFAEAVRTKPLGQEPVKMVDVGRVSKIKDPMTMIEATKILRDVTTVDFRLVFIGSPVTDEDKEYSMTISDRIKRHGLYDVVSFAGDVAPRNMPEKYAGADIAINLTPTGGLDKTVLEAMAAGIPVFTANEAFRDYLGEYAERLIFKHGDPNDLAVKISQLMASKDYEKIGKYLQDVARKRCDVSALITRISFEMKSGMNDGGVKNHE